MKRSNYSHGEAEQQREMTGPGNSQSLHHTRNKPGKKTKQNTGGINKFNYMWAIAAL